MSDPKQTTETTPSNAPSGADRPKPMDAESNPRAAADQLKARGDAMAKKHGG
jgi:hypothetical protein